ncbi:MAG: STAS domain-containing protein [Cytophagaceae bacterium]|nr:STAS domain-containing protein [Cytophagaceae bacterium]
MKLTSEKENDYFIISIEGDLDASSCINLDKIISEAVSNGEKKIMVDCSRLSYISSAGLGVFMSYLQDFEANKVSMVLFGLSEKVQNVFQILGLDQLLKIVNTKEEAKSLINA